MQWGELAAASTFVLALFGVVGIVIRFGLLPYLRSELAPSREAAHQLIGTSEPNEEPTVREQLDELKATVQGVTGEVQDAAAELGAMAMMFDGHLDWAQAEVDKLRAERQELVDELWAELRRQRDAGERPPAPQPRHRGE